MLAREMGWPFIPEIHLFHSREKCEKFIQRRFGKQPEFFDVGAQTWCDDDIAVVLIQCDEEWDAEAALLVHEACHVVQMQCDYICEDNPGDEYIAYCTQVISQALFVAHRKWKEKRCQSS